MKPRRTVRVFKSFERIAAVETLRVFAHGTSPRLERVVVVTRLADLGARDSAIHG
ncbi:MAG: hypothetical protein ABTQ32_10565 [Myxococcaceae bacterium]